MKILLVNPPDCGRSIPEERFGITSIRQIFRGEPLALEELAGNLEDHEVRILDLKAAPASFTGELVRFGPDIMGITGVTCEANTMIRLARQARELCDPVIVVGGIHASNDPAFFYRKPIDFIVRGLGKKSFAELVAALKRDDLSMLSLIPGIIRVEPEIPLPAGAGTATASSIDLVAERPPAYHLVSGYRDHYRLEKLGLGMGFVASAFGCPHRCSFCCIKGQTGGRYLVKPVPAVVRDIGLLGDLEVIRLVDANTFASKSRAMKLCRAIREADLGKEYLADVRADTVVRHPEMLRAWREIGLRAVIIGFEAINDRDLAVLNKGTVARINTRAISILHDLGITIVGDFIIDPQYSRGDFARLADYLRRTNIDLPMITVMTPLPGTPLYLQQRQRIINHDLDYYTLTNAVLPTRLEEGTFYRLYAELLAQSHKNARL